jgi:hypothetical protein
MMQALTKSDFDEDIQPFIIDTSTQGISPVVVPKREYQQSEQQVAAT